MFSLCGVKKGQNSLDFTLFAICALSHYAPCLPLSPPPPSPQNYKNISKHCLQFSWNYCNPREMKNFRLCNFLGGKQGVLWEMCKWWMPKNHNCSAAKPFLVSSTDPCVMATRENSTEFSDCGYLVCLRPFPAAGRITTAFSKFTE